MGLYRKETIAFCKNKSSNTREREKYINDQIKLIEQADPTNDDEDNISKLEEYRSCLEELYTLFFIRIYFIRILRLKLAKY